MKRVAVFVVPGGIAAIAQPSAMIPEHVRLDTGASSQGTADRHLQLSSRVARILRASRSREGSGPSRLGQLRDDGRDRDGAVGEA